MNSTETLEVPATSSRIQTQAQTDQDSGERQRRFRGTGDTSRSFAGPVTRIFTIFEVRGQSLEKLYSVWTEGPSGIADVDSTPLLIHLSADTGNEVARERLATEACNNPAKAFLPSVGEVEGRVSLRQTIERLFAAGREEHFEDGMESGFSKGLLSLVKEYGRESVQVVGDLILSEKANAEIASEALRWLGHMEHPPTYFERRDVLERALGCSSARIRDGAVLGLASLDDPHAIEPLREAIRREHCTELRGDMRQVLEQLEDTRRCQAS